MGRLHTRAAHRRVGASLMIVKRGQCLLIESARLLQPILLLKFGDRLLCLRTHFAVGSALVETRTLQLLLRLLNLGFRHCDR